MKLTIFTPTYNRPHLLEGLYESICEAIQCKNCNDQIEWIVIDDGSVVSYDAVLSVFKNDDLTIIYKKKENGGKHTAFNMAIDICDSDLFVCIDDDDRLTKNSISDIFELGRKYINYEFGAFVGRVVDENNNILGRKCKNKEIISNTIEIRDKYNLWGEPEIYFTKILKQYRFDVFENEKFLTEAYLFDDMSYNYAFVYLQTPLMVKKYLPGGLTDNQLKIRIESPCGTALYYSRRYALSHGMAKIKASINKMRFRFWVTNKKSIKISFVDCCVFPLAFIMFLNDKKNYKKVKKG